MNSWIALILGLQFISIQAADVNGATLTIRPYVKLLIMQNFPLSVAILIIAGYRGQRDISSSR